MTCTRSQYENNIIYNTYCNDDKTILECQSFYLLLNSQSR